MNQGNKLKEYLRINGYNLTELATKLKMSRTNLYLQFAKNILDADFYKKINELTGFTVEKDSVNTNVRKTEEQNRHPDYKDELIKTLKERIDEQKDHIKTLNERIVELKEQNTVRPNIVQQPTKKQPT